MRRGALAFTLSRRSRGRVGKLVLSEFSDEGRLPYFAAGLCWTPLPELRFACSTLPFQTSFGEGELWLASTEQLTCVARLGSVNFTLSRRSCGRVGKRASSVFPGEGRLPYFAAGLCWTPLPELRFACSTLPFKLRLGRVKCGCFDIAMDLCDATGIGQLHPLAAKPWEGRETSV